MLMMSMCIKEESSEEEEDKVGNISFDKMILKDTQLRKQSEHGSEFIDEEGEKFLDCMSEATPINNGDISVRSDTN